MKRIHAFLLPVLLLIMTLLMSPGTAQAAVMTSSQQVQSVQTLEDTLFAVHYDHDTLDARVGRLETTVFGQPQTGALDARISKLQSVLSPSALGPLSPVAKAAPATPANQNTQPNNAPVANNQAANSKPYATSAPQTD
jgi:hypothetical protein